MRCHAAAGQRAFQVPPTLRALNEGNMGTIGEMLNNTPEPEAVVEEVPEVIETQPEAVERPRGPDGKFISKETGVETPLEATPAEPVPPTEPTDRLPQAEYAALRDERRKRQDTEERERQKDARIAALEAQMHAPQQPQAQPVDFWDDPNAFLEQRDTKIVDAVVSRIQQQQQADRLDSSEAAARSKYADYQEKFAAFEQAVQLNPRLAQELARAPDPGEFAYARGKTSLEIERHGSIDALLAAERQKWEQEARAQIQPVQRLPSTTAADGSTGARGGPEWAGPTPLTAMLG